MSNMLPNLTKKVKKKSPTCKNFDDSKNNNKLLILKIKNK